MRARPKIPRPCSHPDPIVPRVGRLRRPTRRTAVVFAFLVAFVAFAAFVAFFVPSGLRGCISVNAIAA